LKLRSRPIQGEKSDPHSLTQSQWRILPAADPG